MPPALPFSVTYRTGVLGCWAHTGLIIAKTIASFHIPPIKQMSYSYILKPKTQIFKRLPARSW